MKLRRHDDAMKPSEYDSFVRDLFVAFVSDGGKNSWADDYRRAHEAADVFLAEDAKHREAERRK